MCGLSIGYIKSAMFEQLKWSRCTHAHAACTTYCKNFDLKIGKELEIFLLKPMKPIKPIKIETTDVS